MTERADADWWLSTNGTAEGPYSTGYLVVGLQSGMIPVTAHVCRVGGQEWKLASEWPELRAPRPETPVSSSPVAPIPLASDSPLTNPKLPTFANWICINAIVVAPMLQLVDLFSCCTTGPTFQSTSDLFGLEFVLNVASTLIGLVSTVLLVLGGFRLRALRSSGPTLILTSIWIDLATGIITLMAGIALFAAATPEELATPTTASEVVSFFVGGASLLEGAFLLVTLVWLYANRSSLPLTAR